MGVRKHTELTFTVLLLVTLAAGAHAQGKACCCPVLVGEQQQILQHISGLVLRNSSSFTSYQTTLRTRSGSAGLADGHIPPQK
jgi:hypothetical protein